MAGKGKGDMIPSLLAYALGRITAPVRGGIPQEEQYRTC